MSTMLLQGAKRRSNLRGSVVLNSSLVILYIIAGLSLISVVLHIEADVHVGYSQYIDFYSFYLNNAFS